MDAADSFRYASRGDSRAQARFGEGEHAARTVIDAPIPRKAERYAIGTPLSPYGTCE